MKTILVIILAVALSLTPTLYARGHKFVNGKLSAVTSSSVVMDGVAYRITKETVIFRYYKEKESFHREVIKYSEINTNKNVSIKVLSGDALEIAVEDY